MVRSFVIDKKMKTEGIEALVYPNTEYKDREGKIPTKGHMQVIIEDIISVVNQRLLPYQRIERTIILDEPLEMTTTKKIKRGG
jgi:long-chain acyl-CoA synthetase